MCAARCVSRATAQAMAGVVSRRAGTVGGGGGGWGGGGGGGGGGGWCLAQFGVTDYRCLARFGADRQVCEGNSQALVFATKIALVLQRPVHSNMWF